MRKNQTEYHIVKQIFKNDSTKEFLATKDNTKLSYSLKQIDLCKITQKEFNEVSNEYRIQSMMNSKFIVKLYDNDGNVVGEDKKEYTADKALNGEDTFEFSFAYNDTLKKDNVKDYSINVVR